MSAERGRRAATPLPPRPLDKSGVQDRLVEELRHLIISGELEPGVRLSEYALAKSFGVSRTPVREALKQLQVEALVQIVPRVGTFVAHASPEEIDELFALKAVLEGLAVRLVTEARPPAALATLKRNVTASQDAANSDDSARYAILVDEFHEEMVTAAGNGKLVAHYRLLMNQLAYGQLVRAAIREPSKLRTSVGEHMEILDLIEQGDADAAEAAMRRHVAASRRRVAAALSHAGE